MRKLVTIQYLRGLAAIGVIAYHAAARLGGSFGAGAGGVDVFFIISGFIMWTITQDRPTSPMQFMADRARRIIPLYWIATCVMAVGVVAGLLPNMVVTPWHLITSLLFIPHFSPSDGEIWPLLVPGWTLNYEMFFYVVFAITHALRRNVQFLALTLSFTALALVGTIYRFSNPVFLTYTAPFQLEFLAGVWLGWLWTKRMAVSPLIGGLMIVAGIGSFAAVDHLALNRVVELGIPALLLVAGALSFEAAGAVFKSRFLLYIGDGSYSIYLWHGLAISIGLKVCGALHLPSWLTFCLLIPAGLFVGLLSYEFLEKPLLRFFSRRRHPTLASAGLPPTGQEAA